MQGDRWHADRRECRVTGGMQTGVVSGRQTGGIQTGGMQTGMDASRQVAMQTGVGAGKNVACRQA